MAEQNSGEALGENKDTSVTVSRTVSFPVKRVWQVLMTDEGAEALLGPGSHFGDKGHTWSAVDGRTGVIRTFHPLEEIRFSWRKDEYGKPSMVELRLEDQGEQTTLRVKHTNLTDSSDLEGLKAKWSDALERIESDCL